MKLVSFANAAFAATASSFFTFGGRFFVSVPFVVGTTRADEDMVGSSSFRRSSTSSIKHQYHKNKKNQKEVSAGRKLTFNPPHPLGTGIGSGDGFSNEEVGPMEDFEEAQGRPMEYYEGYNPQEYVPRDEGRPMEYYEEESHHKTQEYTPPEERGPMEFYEDYGPQDFVPPPPRENEGRPMEYYGEGYNYETRDYAPGRGEEGPLNFVASNHNYNNNNGSPQQQEQQHQQNGKGNGVRGSGSVGRTPRAGGVRPGSIEAQNDWKGPQTAESVSLKNTVHASLFAPPNSLNDKHFVKVFKGGENVIDLGFENFMYVIDGYDYFEAEVQVDFENDCIRFYTEDASGKGFADMYIAFYVDGRYVFASSFGQVYCLPGMGCGDGDTIDSVYLDHDQRGANNEVVYPYAPQKIQWSMNSACLDTPAPTGSPTGAILN